MQALQDVIAHLRAPSGCPWDRALTWSKLRTTLLEETYELLAALDENDAHGVAEEQGDLLVQIAMQAQIASEEGLFKMPDVIDHIVTKLIRRHPHVFGDAVVSGTEDVLANWEAIKRAERQRNGAASSPLAGVPAGLPALAQADAYLERMSRLQDSSEPESPWDRLTRLSQAPVTAEAFGEALFALVAWARAFGVEAESALREVNSRFAARVAAEGHG
jgi:tetrapyrrole methylase family protein/MazG family protein